MFLFNSLHQGTFKVSKLRRHWMRNVFALFVMLCLSTAFLFTGCDTDDPDPIDDPVVQLDTKLIGTWTSDDYGDTYTITANYISYGYGGDSISYAGTVRSVSCFSDTAGVIIIEYDADHKASYWEYDDDWNPTTELPLKGNFIGIYYKDLATKDSVKMGGAYVDGGAEETTLDAAKKAFTAEKENTYIYSYGDYSYSE